ncbi:uncharacterized protein [Paramormyrops kingsleyae]|uniref:uncharacterized protein isoform X2 n=1 Tax=Paramormyrops kingsleyae TaxID=1676925 RepID=UPI003B96B019
MLSIAVYSVVNSKRECQDDLPPGDDVIYPETKLPDSLCPQNVSHDGKAGAEKPGSHPHPYRLTVVCLLLLCFFLTICIIVLSICLHRANRKCSVMEGDLQQLSSKNRNLTEEKEQIQEESSQIEQNCSSLASDNNQLKENYTVLTNYNNHLEEIYSITAKQKDVFQNNYEALINKSQHLRLFCDTTDMQKPCRPCPQGWEPFNSSCYFISKDQKSWKDSRIECLKLGADLVIMESNEEQGFFKGKTDDYWIGLTYYTKTSDWIWLDGRSLTGFQKLSPHYLDENCARSWRTSWEAWTCDTKARWICETRALLLNHL